MYAIQFLKNYNLVESAVGVNCDHMPWRYQDRSGKNYSKMYGLVIVGNKWFIAYEFKLR